MDINTLANIAWEAHSMNLQEYTPRDELMFKSGFNIAFKIQELEKNKMARGLQQAIAKAKQAKEEHFAKQAEEELQPVNEEKKEHE